MRTTQSGFSVLLGPDYAGKSSVMSEFARSSPSWRLISTDERFLQPAHALIGRLRRDMAVDVLPSLGRDYSPEFTASMLQTAVVHLRDRIEESDTLSPTLVDSYYYKILAKCRLAGLWDNPMFTWWRSFPQPRRVVFLDVSTTTAWRRSGNGADTNRLEYYGDHPDEGAFAAYQTTLRRLMLDEISHLPVTVIRAQGDVAQTAQAIRKVLSDADR
ncbi:hypothetical protein [Streptomyces sp. NPDC097640]|uniref:hypothetical protein n=1 Tax=Streptomyces sp. NPDC097640 TaxID=3157229 RepID=UPI00332E9CC5